MRTIFVNPSRKRRRRSGPKRRRRTAGRRRRRNAGITSFVSNPLIQNPRRRRRRNPGMPNMNRLVKDTLTVVAGAAGGAGLNRVGISHIGNFYMRNLARVGAAAAALAFGNKSPMMAAAAAGAVLAPIMPEVEMQLASVAKNPQEVAAELAGLLEADLSDGDYLEEDLDDLHDEVTW